MRLWNRTSREDGPSVRRMRLLRHIARRRKIKTVSLGWWDYACVWVAVGQRVIAREPTALILPGGERSLGEDGGGHVMALGSEDGHVNMCQFLMPIRALIQLMLHLLHNGLGDAFCALNFLTGVFQVDGIHLGTE